MEQADKNKWRKKGKVELKRKQERKVDESYHKEAHMCPLCLQVNRRQHDERMYPCWSLSLRLCPTCDCSELARSKKADFMQQQSDRPRIEEAKSEERLRSEQRGAK